MNDAGPPLSSLVTDALNFFFERQSRVEVARLLLDECGFGLPVASSPDLIERIRIAVLKLADGSPDSIVEHLHAARTDWRDVLVAAGFGEDPLVHVRWANALSTWAFEVKEVSACVYEVTATDKLGQSARFKGTDPEQLLAEARRAAIKLQQRRR